MSFRELPLPPHFQPRHVDAVWRVPYAERAQDAADWIEKHQVRPAGTDQPAICLFLVDCQNTFCLPEYELFVAGRSGRGAIDDNVRLCQFIYRNLASISLITLTMDTHTALQIFHPAFWVNEAGEHPVGGRTVITSADVESGAWRVNPEVAWSVARGDSDYLERHALHYVRTLTEGGKYPLLVWPYHAMLGGIGHALVSALEEAIFFHSLTRRVRPRFEVKGDNPLTEHYSALRPEVMEGPDGRKIGSKNEPLISTLLEYDAVAIAGQAKSHCVAWTLNDLLEEIQARDPALAGKIYLLEDCTSAVVVPGVVDFTDQADEAFARFARAGMHVVRSTDPLAAWPGL
ncbi:MAG: isochorismatase [Gemmatimonadota bacterium]|nr:MAG: isochorismatase [Gemmatimonadota bacterium]